MSAAMATACTVPYAKASLASVKSGERCQFSLGRSTHSSPPCLNLLTSPHSLVKKSKLEGTLRIQKNGIRSLPGVQQRLVISAAQATETAGGEGEGKQRTPKAPLEESMRVLKKAIETKQVSGSEVLAAILKVKEAKVDAGDFLPKLGGTASPGREWTLVFTSGPKDLKAARQGGGGGGMYFPINAVQTFDAETNAIQNGVFLGPVGSLVFKGRFSWKGRMLAFVFDSMQFSLGPLGPFSFNLSSEDDKARTPVGAGNKDPFFLFDYVDDELVVAQGRGGGIALWTRKS